MLTRGFRPLRPHAIQRGYMRSETRFNVVAAGRRSGKTDIAQRRLVKRALGHSEEWPGVFFATAPTLAQAKQIYMDEERGIPSYLPSWALSGVTLSPFPRFHLHTGTQILVFGVAKPHRIEGLAFDGGLFDEVDDAVPAAWFNTLRPMLSDPRKKPGWVDFIGRPRQRRLLYELSRLGLSPAEPEWAFWTWPSSDIISPEEIESAKRGMTRTQFDQEYMASFVQIEGRAYYTYLEETHGRAIRDRYDADQDLYVFLDFNKAPGVAAIGQYMQVPLDWGAANPVMGIIGEVWIKEYSKTPMVCRKLIDDWGKHRGNVRVYGDASGGRSGERTSSVAGTDWDLVREYLGPHFGDRLIIKKKRANPPEIVRLNAMNARFETADGKRHLFVDIAHAPHVNDDFLGVKLVEGGPTEILKIQGDPLTHLSDGIGYWAEIEHPITGEGWTSEQWNY